MAACCCKSIVVMPGCWLGEKIIKLKSELKNEKGIAGPKLYSVCRNSEANFLTGGECKADPICI